MISIQKVPIEGATHMAIWFERDGTTMQASTEPTAAAVRQEVDRWQAEGWKLAEKPMRIFRMKKPLTADEIAAAINRRRPRKSLLAVQQDKTFPDDLNVNDYWQEDWPMTLAILKELDELTSP